MRIGRVERARLSDSAVASFEIFEGSSGFVYESQMQKETGKYF